MGELVVEESIVVDASKQSVWKVFRDLERWPKWNPVCPEAKYISSEPWAKGSVFQFSLITGKRKNRFKPIIVESKPEDKVTWLGKIMGIRLLHTFEFETANKEKTKVTSHEEFSGLLLPLMKILVRVEDIKEMLVRWLTALKLEVEKHK